MENEIKDGGPAFPLPLGNENISPDAAGMTLRDYFAAKAMQANLMTITSFPDESWRIGLAKDSYAMADAMLAAGFSLRAK